MRIEITPRLAALRERLGSVTLRQELQLLVLFGSHVRGRAGRKSDLDVAIQTDGPADLDAWYRTLAPVFGDPLDLVNLRRADPLLAVEIARTGEVLFEREPGIFRRFQALAFLRYADTAKLRQAQRRAIHVFLEKEGLA